MKKQIGLLLGVLLLIGATGCGKEPAEADRPGHTMYRRLSDRLRIIS